VKKPKKKANKKSRNPFAVLAKTRKGGAMRPKKDKRQNGSNKQQEYLSEEY
jgi:hypothetical protein